MADELLPYYEKELAYIRQLGAAFAQEHPKIAARLGVNNDTIEDPHVSRLIESFAYLNARIQHKLNDDLPELTDGLLNVLFPHYQRPIPATGIVQFMADPEQLGEAYAVARNTLIESEPFQGETCRFSTVYPVDLWPVNLSRANLIGRPFSTPGSDGIRGAESVLRLSLRTFNSDIQFGEVKPGTLRFHLKGQSQYVHPLYEMLLNQCVDVVLARSENDTQPVSLGANVIQAVGFGEEDGLLPYPAASHLGYRLLTEFFVFPEKFMFVDIGPLDRYIDDSAGEQLELYIYLRSTDVELEHHVSAENFLLGCTPVVNLFEHRCDPIRLEQTHHEYQVIPDARRPRGYEVYSVDRVVATTASGEPTEYLPLYGLNHSHRDSDNHAFWFASRRHAKLAAEQRDEATDVFLSLVDLHLQPSIPEERVLTLHTTCSNRDLPADLPYDNVHPRLQCVDGSPPCSRIRFINQPNAAIRPPLRDRARWRLLSHLNLNHLSLTGRDDPGAALREILRLYDFRETSATRALVDAVHKVSTRSISAPLNIDGHTMICRGFEIEIELDKTLLTGSSGYLYATVLEHFFALYCSINSFSRVLVKLRNHEGYLKRCPPRSGEQILL